MELILFGIYLLAAIMVLVVILLDEDVSKNTTNILVFTLLAMVWPITLFLYYTMK